MGVTHRSHPRYMHARTRHAQPPSRARRTQTCLAYSCRSRALSRVMTTRDFGAAASTAAWHLCSVALVALHYGILGPLEVRSPEGPVTVRGAKLRTLLAALLLERNRPVDP